MIKAIMIAICFLHTQIHNVIWHLTASDYDRARTACYNTGERCEECYPDPESQCDGQYINGECIEE